MYYNEIRDYFNRGISMDIFEIIGDFFHSISIDIQYFFKTRGKMYECTRSGHGMYIGNAHNIHAKNFNLKVDFNGQNESPETYVGHDYILLKEELNLVFFRDVIEYMHDKYGEDIIIRRISFQTQYNTKQWRDNIMRRKGKLDKCIYLTGDKKKDMTIIEKADSIFYEWRDHRPKFMEFKQSDWNI